MTDTNAARDWSNVDAGDSADGYTDYLETMHAEDAIGAYKQRSHRLLYPASGDRILDVGCGTGRDVRMLAELVGPDGTVVGVDNSETMVETATEAETETDGPTVCFAVADTLNLPFADNSFDAARADRVLQHLAAPSTALAELRRVTRSGGRVSVSDPDWETLLLETPGGSSEQLLSLDYACTRHPTMGRQLYRRANDAGLVDIDIDAWTPTLTDLEFFERAADLNNWTDAMQAAGQVSATDVEDWYDGLRQADEKELLFGSITGFTVVGTVPT